MSLLVTAHGMILFTTRQEPLQALSYFVLFHIVVYHQKHIAAGILSLELAPLEKVRKFKIPLVY
jgi:hypothetical protein